MVGSAARKSRSNWAEELGTETAIDAEPSSFTRVASGSFGLHEPLLVSVEGVLATLGVGGVNPETDIAGAHKAKKTPRTTMPSTVRKASHTDQGYGEGTNRNAYQTALRLITCLFGVKVG